MFSDGSTYTGAWAKSAETGLMVREGRGVYAHVAIGYKYVGEWKNDQMNGYGARARTARRSPALFCAREEVGADARRDI